MSNTQHICHCVSQFLTMIPTHACKNIHIPCDTFVRLFFFRKQSSVNHNHFSFARGSLYFLPWLPPILLLCRAALHLPAQDSFSRCFVAIRPVLHAYSRCLKRHSALYLRLSQVVAMLCFVFFYRSSVFLLALLLVPVPLSASSIIVIVLTQTAPTVSYSLFARIHSTRSFTSLASHFILLFTGQPVVFRFALFVSLEWRIIDLPKTPLFAVALSYLYVSKNDSPAHTNLRSDAVG